MIGRGNRIRLKSDSAIYSYHYSAELATLATVILEHVSPRAGMAGTSRRQRGDSGMRISFLLTGIALLVGLLANPVCAANSSAQSPLSGGASGGQAVQQPSPLATSRMRYITDQFKVTLRAGPGLQYQIIRMLSSGWQVKVLTQDNQTGYTQVEMDSGMTGWMLTHYLMIHPAAEALLKQTQAKLNQTQSQSHALDVRLKQNQTALKAKASKLTALQTSYAILKQKYRSLRITASNAVEINQKNTMLQQHVEQLEKRSKVLMQMNESYQNSALIRWFLAGSGVLLLGLLLGFWSQRLARKRSDNWFS